jgi:hypothetical protein
MDEEIDNDLRDHIREVFDNFEDPTADEGWLLLREEYPNEQPRRRVIAWWWLGAAAILFLFLAIGLWEYSANNHREGNNIVKNRVHREPANPVAQKTQPDTGARVAASVTHPVNPAAGTTLTGSRTFAASTQIQKKTVVPVIKTAKISTDTFRSQNYQAKTTDTLKKNANKAAALLATNISAANQAAKPVQAGAAGKQEPVTKPKADMFANSKTSKPQSLAERPQIVRFSVFAATYVNYARGSSNQANLGAGFSADFRLSKHISVETGLTIAPNSLNFNTAVPTSAAQTSLGVLSPATNAVYPGANVASAYNSASAVTVASIPAFRNYNAGLVGLDIPVNLKYHFNPQKYNLYVLAGLSSGTFINETYTYQYNYPALLSPSLQKVQDEITRKNFNSFYFAKTLNFGFGFGYPVGKSRLVFEPFIKYPLDGIGSQAIHFGSGGLNLKFNFPTSKP